MEAVCFESLIRHTDDSSRVSWKNKSSIRAVLHGAQGRHGSKVHDKTTFSDDID
ncbi:MAG: hypothetical protein QXD42_06495 [Nitrososphaerales archaeon]